MGDLSIPKLIVITIIVVIIIRVTGFDINQAWDSLMSFLGKVSTTPPQ